MKQTLVLFFIFSPKVLYVSVYCEPAAYCTYVTEVLRGP